MKKFDPASSYIRVAALSPQVKIGDIGSNAAQIKKIYRQLSRQDVALALFPELSLTGYTLGDLIQKESIQEAALQALVNLAPLTRGQATALIVGLPVAYKGSLYNCAALIADGAVKGIVPKTFLPSYKEFYESRWYRSGKDIVGQVLLLNGYEVPFGTDLIFELDGVGLGIEICEDLWVPEPPSTRLAQSGAEIILNLSASNELVGKSAYRRELVKQQSARLIAGYVYAGAGVSESTTDLVFGGHCLIAENGILLVENERFGRENEIYIADIDVDHLRHDRRVSTVFENLDSTVRFRTIKIAAERKQKDLLRAIDPQPFIPAGGKQLEETAAEILQIQAHGLATRLKNTGIEKLVLGLSGGLDSTLAILVALKAAHILKISPKNIYALTMPGFASSKRTQSNAARLAKGLGVDYRQIDISQSAKQQLKDLGEKDQDQNVVYENVQARVRTAYLMNHANQIKGLVVGTGDLSEIALGWATYNGDHISHYNVNASIPKTLVKYLVGWAADQPEFKPVKGVLLDILDTPISPELTSKGTLDQKTEDLIGPYELHDFFLYHFVRRGAGLAKISYLAKQAFGQAYSPSEVDKWLKVFIARFVSNQWKRSVFTDGPKVGSVSLSPRGDWRMPADMPLSGSVEYL